MLQFWEKKKDGIKLLDAENIFQFEAISYKNYQTKEGTVQLLSGSFISGNYKDTDKKTRSYADFLYCKRRGK